MVSSEFWLGRWERGETGWHQDEVEPALVEWAALRQPCRVLVPLCGKSLDLVWLAAKGFEVIGVELSNLACKRFFEEGKIDYQIGSDGGFKVFQGGGIKIYNGDFFQFTPHQLGLIGAIYDRAALIALPQELRKKYTTHVLKLLEPSLKNPEFGFLEIAIARTPHDLTGPPFSVPTEEIKNLYGNRFQISLQSREKVIARAPEGSTTEEFVFYLKPR